MLRNSDATYGAVSKFFHWLIALLILTLIPLGIYANALAYDTGEMLAWKAQVFSLHKTLGVTVFFVALARILWAISQPKPAPLHPDRRAEQFLAQTVHWLLYASLILVPLSGWIHHAATSGFAPILWPFGQSLPLVPKNDGLAHAFASLHIIFERILVVSFFLHVAGALKHHFVDRDQTLMRMLPGHTDPGALPTAKHTALPIFGAIAAYAIALLIGAGLGLFNIEKDVPPVPTLAAVDTGWQVQDGTLSITVKQLGSDLTGSFADWTAAITFDEAPDATGKHGEVEVQISVPSLTLGSVTRQAMGADFFNADAHPTAIFRADLFASGSDYIADGTLDIKDAQVDLQMPFALQIEGDKATMTAQTTVNRTDFRLGQAYSDESSVGFDVKINVALTALRIE